MFLFKRCFGRSRGTITLGKIRRTCPRSSLRPLTTEQNMFGSSWSASDLLQLEVQIDGLIKYGFDLLVCTRTPRWNLRGWVSPTECWSKGSWLCCQVMGDRHYIWLVMLWRYRTRKGDSLHFFIVWPFESVICKRFWKAKHCQGCLRFLSRAVGAEKRVRGQ